MIAPRMAFVQLWGSTLKRKVNSRNVPDKPRKVKTVA
jgi:hypothetical protein